MNSPTRKFPQPARKPRCIFCNIILTKSPQGKERDSDKAKEHILKREFINLLGHEATRLPVSFSSSTNIVETREPNALSFVAGEVCRGCNGGWMNELDMSVAKIVLSAASSESAVISFSSEEAVLISRWLLKLACVVESTDAIARRHIPAHIRYSVKNPGYLPQNFVSFYGILPKASHSIGPSILDVWLHDSYAPTPIALQPGNQSKRLKFAVQYNRALFGCAYVHEPGIVFRGITHMHTPIFISSDTSFSASLHPEIAKSFDGLLGKTMADSTTNRWLLGILAHQSTRVFIANESITEKRIYPQ